MEWKFGDLDQGRLKNIMESPNLCIFETLELWHFGTKKPRNQETTKPRSTETKKPPNQETKQPRNKQEQETKIFKFSTKGIALPLNIIPFLIFVFAYCFSIEKKLGPVQL